jgi:zinc D-Ala-D-Ala carboxypeptidase
MTVVRLSRNFTLAELLKSDTAVRHNLQEQFNPPIQIVNNLGALCVNVLQPLRDAVKQPIYVTSGYRCDRLNTIVGGSRNSQHRKGEAADIELELDGNLKAGNKLLFETIIALDLPFDQLINEFDYSWIHVSFTTRRKPRQQILQAVRRNGKVVYLPYKPS